MSDDVPLAWVFVLLLVLIALSAFFSSSETALMSINRYRLRHQARSGHRGARLAESLLRRPDRLIGLILLGNNLVNLAAAALVTLISLRLGGEAAIAIGTGILTIVILIFAEVGPKTIAALNPPRIALPAAFVYYPLLKVAYPIVWLVNFLANGVLRMVGVNRKDIAEHSLSAEELKTVVAEAGAMVPRRHRRMLISILDLENTSIEDVMIPRQDIVGIDLEDDWEHNLALIRNSEYSRLPVYRGEIDNTIGVVQLRKLLPALARNALDVSTLQASAAEPFCIPEGTSLNKQLVNFNQARQRFALVVDEYGDIQGLVTLEDILREIVGELGTLTKPTPTSITKENNGCYVVDAGATVREINRQLNIDLPTDGPTTLNGLIIEELETFPTAGTALKLADHPIEILTTDNNLIKQVRVYPAAPPSESAFG